MLSVFSRLARLFLCASDFGRLNHFQPAQPDDNQAPQRGASIFSSRLAEGSGEEPGGSPRRRARPATIGSAAEADSPRCQGGRSPARSAPPGAGRASRPAPSGPGRPVPERSEGSLPPSKTRRVAGWVQFRRAQRYRICAHGGGSRARSTQCHRSPTAGSSQRVLPPLLSPTSRQREVVFLVRKAFLTRKKTASRGWPSAACPPPMTARVRYPPRSF